MSYMAQQVGQISCKSESVMSIVVVNLVDLTRIHPPVACLTHAPSLVSIILPSDLCQTQDLCLPISLVAFANFLVLCIVRIYVPSSYTHSSDDIVCRHRFRWLTT